MKKIKETCCFTKNGITIFVKIDYVNNKISLVEPNVRSVNNFKMKEFIFVNRGVEYVNGWLNILDAMKHAMEEAKKMYENNLAEVSAFKSKQLEDVMIEVAKRQ